MLEFLNIKTFFAKGYTPNWSEEVFVINKIKNTVKIQYIKKKRLMLLVI